jgi:2-polyprenyl-3-methyl-5-hydroxy-6-metoxy-1,4-benzoquinol methylase
MSDSHRTISEDDLARLKEAREDADRRYNAALTAVDAAIARLPEFPHTPALPDETQVTPLNTRWDVLKAQPVFPSGWRGRVARFVWSLLEPPLAAQQAFNSALVDHVNRNIPLQREIPKAIDTTIALLRQQVEQFVHFQSRLIVYLQQVTPYVDTKDYEVAGLGRRVSEDALEQIERLDRTARGLAAGISGVSDEMLKRWESLLARDQRYTGRIDEIRASLAVAQQQVMTLKREFDRLPAGPGTAPAVTSRGIERTDADPAARVDSASSRSESWKYVGFENLFRGSQDEIRQRLQTYAPLFEGVSEVLDVGCGRGEFLQILSEHGIRARGIDVNHEMVETCRERGLEVSESDALAYLRIQPDESLGGLMAAQVVEHLEPAYLLEFLNQAQRVLRPGSPIVLETINAACWLAFFESYIRDITHARALHPDTLKYLVTASGFVDAAIEFKAPVPPADRLQPAPQAAQGGEESLAALAEVFDGNVERLNRLLFTHLDYAVIARRP